MSSVVMSKIAVCAASLCLAAMLPYAHSANIKGSAENDTAILANQGKIKVGMLIPPKGTNYEAATKPIKEGVYAGYEQDKDSYEMVEYELKKAEDVFDVLNKAAEDKVMLVIGPVLRNSVEKTVELPYLPVPVIAINRVEGAAIPELYMSIDLAVEGEAEQLVQIALDRTAGRSGDFLILATNDPYDQRVAKALASELEKNKAKAETLVLNKQQAGSVKSKIEGKQYRGVLFSMNPSNASLVRPFLPEDLVLFGTSYTNPSGYDKTTIQNSKDLTGMVTLEIPAITQMSQTTYSKYRQQLNRLSSDDRYMFAVGVDAWNLGKDWLHWSPKIQMESGLSGHIQFDKTQSSRAKRVMDTAVVAPIKPRVSYDKVLQTKEQFSFEESASDAGM